MGRNSAEEKLEHYEEEEEEEALSLCDLPVNLNKDEKESSKEEIQETEDFDFEPLGGCVSLRSEMCAADDIFFKGQILPFRLSFSSENCHNNCNEEKNLNPGTCLSRSESMDHSSVGRFTSFSSRSSSSRSQFSSSSSVTTITTTTTPTTSKLRTQNQFFTHSSPKPQIRIPSSSLGNAATNRNIRKSTVWEFFRLGLVRTPEIELQDLKARNSVSRNSSSSSSSNSNNSSIKISSSSSSSTGRGKKMEKQRKQSFLEKRLLLSGCNCTVNSVKPVPLNIIIIKSNNDKNEETEKQIKKKNYKKKMVENKKQQQHQQQGRKQAVSRHRTFEWIKELSYSSFVDQEEGHSLLA